MTMTKVDVTWKERTSNGDVEWRTESRELALVAALAPYARKTRISRDMGGRGPLVVTANPTDGDIVAALQAEKNAARATKWAIGFEGRRS